MNANFWMSLRWNEGAGKYRMYCHQHEMWWQDCPCWGPNSRDFITQEDVESVTPKAGAYIEAAEAALGKMRDLPSSER